MKTFLLLIAGLAVIVTGVVSFAAFESHIVKIKAHVESATYTTPYDIDFKTVFPQEVVYKWCGPHDDGEGGTALGEEECIRPPCPPPPTGECAKIWLSHSFLEQGRVKDVTYDVYCEGPSTCKDGEADCTGGTRPQAITPYLKLYDSDPKDGNDKVVTAVGNCLPARPGADPTLWAQGKLHTYGMFGDEVDWWDLTFCAPACLDNYNSDTDPGPAPQCSGLPPFVDNCNKGPDPDSYRWVDMAGNLKFQVTGFSYGCVCPRGESSCVECQ